MMATCRSHELSMHFLAFLEEQAVWVTKVRHKEISRCCLFSLLLTISIGCCQQYPLDLNTIERSSLEGPFQIGHYYGFKIILRIKL